jgi:hypothetical protein
MSAFGQKQTCAAQNAMYGHRLVQQHHWPNQSAFAVATGGKADMPFCTAYVRFWPKADIASNK